MLETDWSFFMPDTALEKTEMEQACDDVSAAILGWARVMGFPTLEVVEVDTDDRGITFALDLHIPEPSADTIDCEVA